MRCRVTSCAILEASRHFAKPCHLLGAIAELLPHASTDAVSARAVETGRVSDVISAFWCIADQGCLVVVEDRLTPFTSRLVSRKRHPLLPLHHIHGGALGAFGEPFAKPSSVA